MPDYFGNALHDFVQNFAWGGTIEHLLQSGYSVDRMIKEQRVALSKSQIIELAEKINKRRIAEGKSPFEIK